MIKIKLLSFNEILKISQMIYTKVIWKYIVGLYDLIIIIHYFQGS